MRDLKEIKETKGLIIKKEKSNGFGGTLFPIEYKNGKAKIIQDYDKVLHFIFSWACGFEHLSVSTTVKTPTWEQMSMMKNIFWREDEICMQLHPAKENYIDNMPHCLHIWRPINKEIPTPPNLMVGIRANPEDFKKDVKEFIEKSTENGDIIDEETKKELRMIGVDI